MKQSEIEVGGVYVATAHSWKPARKVVSVEVDDGDRRGGVVKFREGQLTRTMSLEAFARWARHRVRSHE